VAAEPDAVDDLIAACARLPLALAIAAARAATHPQLPLAALAAELCDARRTLDAFHGGDPATDVRVVFSRSYHVLSPASARLFRLLGLPPGPEIAIPAAASLAGVPIEHVWPLLAELTRAHLVAEPAPGRFTLHDLLRAYAAELARDVDTEAAARAASLGWLVGRPRVVFLGPDLDHAGLLQLAQRGRQPICAAIFFPNVGP
jgi:hypothetical protein